MSALLSVRQKDVNTKVTLKDWYRLFSYGIGNFRALVSVALSFIYNGIHVYIYIVLAEWVIKDKEEQQDSNEFYLYAGLILLAGILMPINYLVNSRVFWSSSKALHKKMTWKILRAPMHFHDTNSVGTILTKFSKDIQSLGKWLLSHIFVLQKFAPRYKHKTQWFNLEVLSLMVISLFTAEIIRISV